MRTQRLRSVTSAIAVALAVMAAGCGAEDSVTGPTAERFSGETNSTVRSVVPMQGTGSTTMVEPRRLSALTPDGLGPEELAFVADAVDLPPETTTSTAATTTTTSSAPASAPTTTTGSGGAPVVTSGGGGGGDVSIYQGVLGSIEPDQLITPAVAAPPAAHAGIMPLTGLPGTVPNRPAAVVKVDNGSKARPQTGLNSADIVIEEEVEGGITRFAAIFHSTPSIVGPIRSGRTTDIGILNGLGSPLMMYSGANHVTDTLLRAQSTVQNRNAGTSSGYWRSSSRRAPSNLYSDTAPHWASATGGPPPPQFEYRADGVVPTGTDVTSLKVSYRASKAAWTWDGSTWLRSQGGRAHMTASGQQISAANVIVIEAREVASGMVDSSGANVPEFVFVGTDKAVVFTGGKRIDGVWTRPTLRSVATLTTADGSVIELSPGRTWIELIGAGSGILG